STATNRTQRENTRRNPLADAHRLDSYRETGTGSGRVESDVRPIPAEADGAGTVHPAVQCAGDQDPPGGLSRGEGSGDVRFLSVFHGEQAESSGTGTVRVDHTAVE